MDIVQKILYKRKYYDLRKIFIGRKPENTAQLRVLILNAPCNGFGDIIFSVKFSNLLKEWYNCKVTILTPQKDAFVSLGADPNSIIELTSNVKTNTQCRRFKFLNMDKKPDEADLIFVAPLQSDYGPSILDVRSLLPYANRFNTFFVSEYNDSLNSGTDFHTGVGGTRDGLLLTDTNIGSRPSNITNPYCVVYVAKDIGRMKSCVYNFVKMVARRYSKSNFEIITPNWMEEVDMIKPLCRILSSYFGAIIIKRKNMPDEVIEFNNKKYNVYLRLDIFPLKNAKMIDLMYYSVKDILLTGDQSITDALSCCSDKNIFYQIAPWKKNFADNLVKELPNKWLKKTTESCGGLKAIRYKSNYKGFKKKWDFRSLAKPQMDTIFFYAVIRKSSPIFQKYEELVMKKGRKSKEIKKVLNQIISMF